MINLEIVLNSPLVNRPFESAASTFSTIALVSASISTLIACSFFDASIPAFIAAVIPALSTISPSIFPMSPMVIPASAFVAFCAVEGIEFRYTPSPTSAPTASVIQPAGPLNAFITNDAPCASFPSPDSTGPTPAVTASIVMIVRCWPSSILANPSIIFVIAPIAASRCGVMALPKDTPAAIARFLRIFNLLAFVSYRLFASLVNATFSLHAPLATPSAFDIRSLAPVSLSKASRVLTSLYPRSASVSATFPPESSTAFNPDTNDVSACAGSAFHAAVNSLALMPDILAYLDISRPPFAAAISILSMTLDMAEPPASASMPTDAIAAASAMMLASLIFT